MRKALVLWLATLLWTGAPAPAAALDAEGLRQDIESALTGGLSPFMPQAIEFQQVRTHASGDAVQVEIWGVILPLAASEGRVVIGDVGFTVAEAGPGLYRVSDVSLPGGATLRGPQGNDEAFVNYRLGKTEGVWSSALIGFLSFDVEVSNFETIVPAEGFGLSIARFTANLASTTRPDGLVDQDAQMSAATIDMLLPEQARLRLAGLEASAGVKGYDFAAAERIISEIQALSADGEKPAPEQLSALFQRFAEEGIMPESFFERIGVSALGVAGPGGEPLFSLDSSELNMKADGLNQAFGTASFGLRFGGLDIPQQRVGSDDPMQQLVPHSGGVVVTAHRLPLRELWTTFFQMIAQSTTNPAQPPNPDVFAAMMGIQMLAAIQRAGTTLALDRLYGESPAAGISAKGLIEPQPASALGFAAKGEARLTGLDRLIELAQQLANPQAGPDTAVAMLTRLKEIGRRQVGNDGKAVDSYDMVLTARGEFLVNGQPFGPPGAPGAPGAPGGPPQ